MSDIMKLVDSYEFIFFLTWLAEEKDWNSREIIGVVEKQNSYQKEYDEYKQTEEE